MPSRGEAESEDETTARKTTKIRVINGAARGIRTPDPIITNDVLYQLS